jgi:uncharacterized 2Fe-2S/4Fe-4S cluster protein (DUF4445 family)
MKYCKITFLPDNKTVMVDTGSNILEAARKADISISSACGGNIVCGKCRVIVKSGNLKQESGGLLSPEELKQGLTLACATTISEDATIQIPPESHTEKEEVLLQGKLFNLNEFLKTVLPGQLGEAGLFKHSPLATKLLLKFATLRSGNILNHLYEEIKNQYGYPATLSNTLNRRETEKLLSATDGEITLTLGKVHDVTEITNIEPGNKLSRNHGLAIDIGTTTVVVHLVDLINKKTIDVAGSFNKQIAYGDDIITRIMFAEQKGGLEELNLAVTENINSLTDLLLANNNLKTDDINAVMVAGNTTMIHLFLNINPSYLRKEPYMPTSRDITIIPAKDAGIIVNPHGLLSCAPNVSSFVGGDVTAGVLVSGLTEKDELSMYIDMGTNGEIVFGNKDWLSCCACSIGPAFEGSGMKSGTRAVKGAIQKITISLDDYRAMCSVIGDVKPKGICGSGLIDLISEMLKTGLINRAGKIQKENKSHLIRNTEEGLEYIVVPATESGTEKDIVISQPDLDNLVRSKAAVYAGARTLIRKIGYTFEDIKRFYIAGAFGSHLDIEKAISIGMLPDIPKERFEYIGNASVTGAALILLSYPAMIKVQEVADAMTYIELSNDNIFHDEFMSAMFLPHTDLTLFPRYK